MLLSGQVHTLSVFCLKEELLVPIRYEAHCLPDLFWTQEGERNMAPLLNHSSSLLPSQCTDLVTLLVMEILIFMMTVQFMEHLYYNYLDSGWKSMRASQ